MDNHTVPSADAQNIIIKLSGNKNVKPIDTDIETEWIYNLTMAHWGQLYRKIAQVEFLILIHVFKLCVLISIRETIHS